MSNGTNGNGISNGARQDAAVIAERDLLWDGLSPAVAKALSQPLDPGLVSQRRGRAGRSYSYIEGHTVIDQANEVFGYGGWGYELVGDVTLRQIEVVDPKSGEVKRIRAYSAPVRVTVLGAPPRMDVGFHAVVDESADGHETACKGAVTDGLKRALRSFGDRFGNGLYGDGHVSRAASSEASDGAGRAPARRSNGAARQDEGVASPRGAAQLRKEIFRLGGEQGFDEGQVRNAVRERTGRDIDDLTAQELTPLVESAARKVQRMRRSQTPEAA